MSVRFTRMCGSITPFLRAALLVAMLALVAFAGASILGDLGTDSDDDGIPDSVEVTEGTNPAVKDNDVFASKRLLVMQVFRDFLGREADAGGLAFWQGQLVGGLDSSTFIEGVQGQAEFQARVAPVIRLYLTAFNRRPDHGGLTFWARQFAGGTSLESIATAFAGSPEFLATYGALTNRQFIELLYLNTLNRPGDVRGVDFWTAQLEGGFQTRGQMLVTFSESTENISVSEPEVLVAMAYAGMLNRTADVTGYNFWVDRVTLAFDRVGLIRAFFLSQEYRNRFLPPPTPPTITSAAAATFYVGAAGSFSVTATGVPSPSFAVSGALPAGVTFNASTGVLSGTPASGTAGTYPLTITAANGNAPDATQGFTLTVSPAVAITSVPATAFLVGTAGTFTVTTASAPVAATITHTGALPAGVTFVNNGNGTATLAGTPGAGTGGTYPITITAANGVTANGTQNFTLTVNQAPAITSGNSTTFQVNVAGTFSVVATGFPVPTLSITAGALPAGVTLTAAGVLSGTPTATGTFNFTITAANGVALDATQGFTLTVNNPAGAADDAFTTAHDTPLTVVAPGILGNDSGTPLPTLLSVTGTGAACTVFPCTVSTANGSVTVQASGGFTYTPNANFAGVNTFTYVATNPAGSDPATVTITVTNAAPVADLDGALTGGINLGPVVFTEDGGPVAIVGTANPNWLTITDADGPTLASATIVLTNVQDAGAEMIAVTCLPASAPACSGAIVPGSVVTASAPGTYTITIAQVAALVDYEALLRTLTYVNTSQNPTLAPNRDITVTVNDGIAPNSPVARATVALTASNDAPVLAAIEAGALAYGIGGPAVPVTSSLTVTDIDSTNLAGATVQITANCANADDVLVFTPQNGISGNYVPATCTMTLAGSATVANYQAALRAVRFQNTNAATSLLARTVTFQVNDGGAASNLSNTVTRNVTLATNGAPVLNAGATLNYNEGQAPTAIDTTVTVTDADSSNLVAATVQITANCLGIEDVLSFTNQSGITGSYNAGTCTMTLTGSASLANYQTALRSVQYSNSSQNPSTATRTVTWQGNDGGAINNLSNTPTSTINVAATNSAPVVTAGGILAYTENDPATAIAPALTVTDGDSPNLAGATMQITANCNSAQDVLAFANQNGITGTYTAATCLMSLAGAASVANYQAALRSITYANSSESPSTLARTVTWIANDGALPSTSVTSTINVTAVEDAPVLAAIEVGALGYTENAAATPITTTLTVTDIDSTNLASATIQITANCTNPQDVLSFTNQNGISGSYNGATCTMTLTGSSSVANYQTALRSVAYANSSENPNALARVVTFQVNDGSTPSNTVTRNITVTAVNDPPTAAPFAGLPAQAGIPITYSAGKLTGTDPEGTAVTVDTTPINVTNGTVTINANGSFTFTPAPLAATASFQYRVTDSGSPAPPQNSAYATVGFTVTGPAIFFVKNPAVGLANCTLGNECLFATAIAGIGATTGASIFIADANTHTAGSTLNANGRVIGQGITGTTFDTFFSIGAPAEGALAARPLVAQSRPIVTAGAGTTLTLGSNNTLRGFDLGNTSAAGTGLSGTGFGTLTASDMSVGTTGSAFTLTTGTTAVTFDAVASSGGTNNVNLNAVAGSLVMGGGSLAGATGAAFNVAGGTGSITYSGTITSGTGRSVSIANKTAGTVTFNGLVTDADTGISLTTNTGATIAFTGGLSLSTGANTAFAATGGGTVTATQNNTSIVNTIATTTGTALNVANTTIGAADLTFRSISSNGGTATGIILDTTGSSGSLIVTGNAGVGTGGTIANKAGTDGQSATGIGIYLNSTLDPSFSWMQLNDFGNYAIRGFVVNGLTLDRVVVNGTNGTTDTIAAVSSPEGSVAFGASAGELGGPLNGLIGSASITNSSFSGAFSTNFRVVNQSGTLDRLTLNAVTIGANSTANGNDGLLVEPQGTAVIKLTVTGSTFTSSRGDLLQYVDNGSGAGQDVVITNNAFSNNHPAIATGGGGVTISSGVNNNLPLTITGNTFRDAVGPGVLIVKTTGTGTLSGTFANNSIGVSGVANSGSAEGSALKLQTVGQGTVTMAITNNQVFQYNNFGIELLAGGGATLQSGAFNTTITGNTVAQPGTTAGTLTIPKNGIHLNIGTVPGDTFLACSVITGNVISASGIDATPPTGTGDNDFRLRQRQATTIRLPGYAGAISDNAAVVAFVAANNPAGGAPVGLVSNTVPTGGGYTGTGSTCP